MNSRKMSEVESKTASLCFQAIDREEGRMRVRDRCLVPLPS